MTKEYTIDNLIKIKTKNGRLTANWDKIPQGEWTKDMTWVGNPADEELAALAILAHRNLRQRVADQPESCVKVWGIGEGYNVTLAYNRDQTPAEKVKEIGTLAVLISVQPIPRKR